MTQRQDMDWFIYDDWIDCNQCGGEGVLDDECECETVADICSCAVPTPRTCPQCKGKGYLLKE
jgi:DnaJ-class molecular chaperone